MNILSLLVYDASEKLNGLWDFNQVTTSFHAKERQSS
jgi:hypothetical protein